MRRTALVAVVALSVLLPAAGASASPQAGWRQLRSAAGFTVSAPASWVDFSRATPTILARARTDPKLQAYVDLVKRTKAVKLVAVDLTPARLAAGFATNLNVVQLPTIGDARLQADATTAQLRGLGILVGNVHTTRETLPAGPTSKLEYRAHYTTGGQVVSTTQFFLVHGGKAVVLTYTTLPSLETAYRAVFERSARSFRFG